MDVMRENVDVKTPATNFIALGRDSTVFIYDVKCSPEDDKEV